MMALRINGIEIELPPEVEVVKAAYQRSVDQRRLGPTGRLLARGHIRIVFQADGPQTSAEIGNRRYPLHPFTEAQGRTYWVGCELELTPNLGSYEFSNIGLIIALQTGGDSMEPVLRAEWERSRDLPPGQHAQPHWHIYMTTAEHHSRTRLLAFENDEWKSYGEEWLPVSPSDIASTEQQAVARFHLAMASRWHLRGEHPQYEPPDEQKLGLWVTGCLAYVRAQLLYIAGTLARPLPF